MKKALTVFLALLACGRANAADLALDGRWLDAASNAVANATVPATMKVYTNDAANAVAIASAPVTIATDADGFFRTATTNLSLPPGCRTFWLGVTPQDGTEIAPRMRISPAPFAFRAAEARMLDVPKLSVEGTVTIGTLSNAVNVQADTVSVEDNLTLRGDRIFDQGAYRLVGDLYVKNIDLGATGHLSLFRGTSWWDGGELDIACEYPAFDAHNTWKLTPEDDGLFVMRLEMTSEDEFWMWNELLCIDNGDFAVDVNHVTSLFSEPNRCLFFTLPVRRRQPLTIYLDLWRSFGTAQKATLRAYYKFYYAGYR